jgi:hypothetical protein
MMVRIHTSKDKVWEDEAGLQIPVKRITSIEKMKEKHAAALVKKAFDIQNKLIAFKEEIADKSLEIQKAVVKSSSDKPSKGNYTWFNFDRSIKIEVNVSERIDFDDLEVMACKDKLNQYIADNVQSKDEFVTELIESAFSRKNGNLDAKKVMSLLHYSERVKAPLFLEAMKHLKSAIRRPDSKTYYKISIKNEEGKYENIDTNLSNL